MASPPSTIARRPVGGAGASLAERAYHVIREQIVSLELGPGAVIDERALIQQLSIGRTPIREALRRLAQEQLVEVYPRRGMFVTAVDVRDLARLSEVRAVLESEAARLAAERASPAERAELGALIDELAGGGGRSGRELMACDERIHRALYRCAHNRFLEATLERYYVLALRIWYLTLDQAQALEDAVLEHRGLLEAVRDGQGQQAAALMHLHVEEFGRAMRRALTSVPEPRPPAGRAR